MTVLVERDCIPYINLSNSSIEHKQCNVFVKKVIFCVFHPRLVCRPWAPPTLCRSKIVPGSTTGWCCRRVWRISRVFWTWRLTIRISRRCRRAKTGRERCTPNTNRAGEQTEMEFRTRQRERPTTFSAHRNTFTSSGGGALDCDCNVYCWLLSRLPPVVGGTGLLVVNLSTAVRVFQNLTAVLSNGDRYTRPIHRSTLGYALDRGTAEWYTDVTRTTFMQGRLLGKKCAFAPLLLK